MKKEFIKYSLLVLVCFSMMACNDWLSVKPKTEMEAEDLKLLWPEFTRQ